MRAKQLAIAVVLTMIDVAAGNYRGGLIWRASARGPIAERSLLALLYLWCTSVVDQAAARRER